MECFAKRPDEDRLAEPGRALDEGVALAEEADQQVIDEHWAKSREYGVTGVPTFVIGSLGVVGAQPYEALEDLVERARA